MGKTITLLLVCTLVGAAVALNDGEFKNIRPSLSAVDSSVYIICVFHWFILLGLALVPPMGWNTWCSLGQ